MTYSKTIEGYEVYLEIFWRRGVQYNGPSYFKAEGSVHIPDAEVSATVPAQVLKQLEAYADTCLCEWDDDYGYQEA